MAKRATSRIAVVGIDFGSDSAHVALARGGKIDILTNETGSRKTPSYVGFDGKQRLVGAEAQQKLNSRPNNVFTGFNTLIGRNPGDPGLEQLKSFLQYPITTINDASMNTRDGHKRLGVNVDYNGENKQLTAEELTGIFLARMKSIVETAVDGQTVEDCVMSVPDWWTERERRAMMAAARLGGWKPLGMLNESTALALYYGFLRELPDDPFKVMFVDMGHTHTTFAVAELTNNSLKMLSRSYTPLGGRDFTKVLFDMLSMAIKKRYKLDVSTSKKATLKLLKECNRLKAVLSANTTARWSVEYLMNDTDVKGEITRDEFEKASQSLLSEFTEPLSKCMADAKTTFSDLHSVEAVGGGVRVQAVTRFLEKAIDKKLSKTCDSDEAICRGCALQCAMLSTSFKVKKFTVQDCCGYPVSVSWGEGVGDKMVVFDRLSKFPVTKKIPLRKDEDFNLSFHYADPSGLPSPNIRPLLNTSMVQGVSKQVQSLQMDTSAKKPKIEVHLKMDWNGFVSVRAADFCERYQKDDEKKVEEKTEEKDPKKAKIEPQEEGPEKSKTEKVTEAAAAAKTRAKEETAVAATDAFKTDEKKKKWFVRRRELVVTNKAQGGFTAAQITALEASKTQMAKADEEIKERENAFNSLESYILEMRGMISDGEPLCKFLTETAREAYSSQLSAGEDWMYDAYDNPDVVPEGFLAKRKELAVVGDTALARQEEYKLIKDLTSKLENRITTYDAVGKSAIDDNKYAHIEQKDKDEVISQCTEIKEWLLAQLAAQAAVPTTEDPKMKSSDLSAKLEELEAKSGEIVSKPAPKKNGDSETEPEKDENPEGEPLQLEMKGNSKL